MSCLAAIFASQQYWLRTEIAEQVSVTPRLPFVTSFGAFLSVLCPVRDWLAKIYWAGDKWLTDYTQGDGIFLARIAQRYSFQ